MKYIERPEYMQRLLDLMGTPDIKIITGVRRSGKSELMKAYIRRISEIQPDANIIFVDFFDLKYEGLKEYHALYDYIESHYAAGKKNYEDEVQLCEKFELAINSLHSSRKYDLYQKRQSTTSICQNGRGTLPSLILNIRFNIISTIRK